VAAELYLVVLVARDVRSGDPQVIDTRSNVVAV
jgi:hypothetical protein